MAAEEPQPYPLRDELLILLMLAIAAAALSLAARGGNLFSNDEYLVAQQTLFGPGAASIGRPLTSWAVWFLGPRHSLFSIRNDLLFLAVRVLDSWLLYRLAALLLPGQRPFAAWIGVIHAGFMPHDIFMQMGWNSLAVTYLAGPELLLALIGLFRFRQGGAWPWLALALGMLTVSVLHYEVVLPLAGAVPAGVYLFARPRARRDWIGLGAWYAVLMVLGTQFVLFRLLNPASYVANTLEPVSAFDLLMRALVHWGLGLLPLLGASGVAGTASAMLVGCIMGLLLALGLPAPAGRERSGLLHTGTRAILIGIILSFLGFLPFLPSQWARGMFRVHVMAHYGEALVFAGLIWLLTALLRSEGLRRALLALLLAAFLGLGAGNVAAIQIGLIEPGLTAVANSQYRLFAASLPDLRPGAALYYVELHPEECSSGLREYRVSPMGLYYYYAERFPVMGVLPGTAYGVSITGITRRQAADPAFQAGIAGAPRFGWDQVVVVGAPDCGPPAVLPELPAALMLGQDPDLYHPEALILHGGWLPERIVRLLPPAQPLN